MGIKLGLLGLGSFGSCFAPLFASHPLVDGIALCDAEESKIERWANDPRVAKNLLRVGASQILTIFARKNAVTLLQLSPNPGFMLRNVFKLWKPAWMYTVRFPGFAFLTEKKCLTGLVALLTLPFVQVSTICLAKPQYSSRKPNIAKRRHSPENLANMFLLKPNTPMMWIIAFALFVKWRPIELLVKSAESIMPL